MTTTKYGNFDGNEWERVCQVCFHLKYEKDSYQEVKASPGDYGIEGFTRAGDVFQCYCPEKDYTQDELYEKVRDKITRDLEKLNTYQVQLKSKLNGTKIKRWVFVTPKDVKNQILDHCAKKSDEYRKLKLDILDDKFDVLIRNLDFCADYLPIAINSIGNKLYIEPDKKDNSDIEAFEKSGSEQATNIINKSVCIIENSISGNRTTTSDKLAKSYIIQYLNGYSVIGTLQKKFGNSYEKYLRNITEMEEQLEQKKIYHDSSNKDFIKEISLEVSQRINNEFNDLEQTTKNRLSNYVIASWLADCPLRFDV